MLDSIPWRKLEQGINLIFENLQTLIDSADILYQNRKYPISISLSILAFEETSKAGLLLEHYENKTDLPRDLWNALTKTRKNTPHYNKLLKFLKQEKIVLLDFSKLKKPIIDCTEEELNELAARFYNNVKKNVFYVDWDSELCKWVWFRNDHPEDRQKSLAIRFLRSIKKRFIDLEKHKRQLL